MKNSLTYTIPFSFRGEIFKPTCIIDLDQQVKLGALPCLYRHLANENQIDVYSHEYDVMMMGEIVFESAEGVAKDFISENRFDFEGFSRAWENNKHDDAFQAIVAEHMSIEGIGAIDGLKESLHAAYQLGLHERPD